MAVQDLGKVAMTFGGNYSASTLYDKLTVVVPSDGNSYVSLVPNVINVEPGSTTGWENYWQILSMRGLRGSGIDHIEKTGTSGTIDTYTIYYQDGSTWTYTVSNGEGIQSIVKTGTNDNVDTYTITFGNNQTATFTDTNAKGFSAGGSPGHFLMKKRNTDYDTEWQNITKTVSVSLPVAGWSNNSQTVSVQGVTPDNNLIVSPVYASQWAYNLAGVGAAAQGNGTITFNCRTKPTTALMVNIMIIS
jgi:hypothetical protein